MIDLSSIPTNPGCYLFKNQLGIILYIGKAKNLKKRVSSYFQKKDLDPKTAFLVSLIKDMEFIVTDNEVEALILENNLIKKHKPKFNIDLKDSKRYAYLQLTNEEFPRLIIARLKEDSKGNYYGPFVSATDRDNVLYTLKKTFKLRTCKKMPKKPCLRYSIGLCDAPCIGLISKKDYEKKISNVRLVLTGKTSILINQLKNQMENASTNKDYEKAIEFREQISSLEELSQKQKMERGKSYNEDIMNYILSDNKVYLMIFNIDKGTIINRQEFIFEYNAEFFEEFILQYYSKNDIPQTIILPQDISPSLKIVLEKNKKQKLSIEVPKIGDKKALLDLIIKNIELTFFSNLKQLEHLQNAINLQEVPAVIECFDVSHLGGTNSVASMVQFRNGVPDKSNYRRFKINSVEGIDDTASINEVVFRRYYKLKKENLAMPNLIVIDGGKGQLNSALDSLNKLGLKIPVISLAKRLEEIFVPGSPDSIILKRNDPGLLLLQKIRDEAHRFAISYQKIRRRKELIGE